MFRSEHVLLRALAIASVLGGATAQSCRSAATVAFVQEGYDFSSVTEAAITITGFDVTGITCASGYTTATGTKVATAVVCTGADLAYTGSGCLPCTPGLGLCDSSSTAPNQVDGDLAYFQDTGVTVRLHHIFCPASRFPVRENRRCLARGGRRAHPTDMSCATAAVHRDQLAGPRNRHVLISHPRLQDPDEAALYGGRGRHIGG